MKKIISNILIILGALPYVCLIIIGLWYSINGFCFSLFIECTKEYGIDVFLGIMQLYFIMFLPIFIIGLILLIIGIVLKLKVKVK